MKKTLAILFSIIVIGTAQGQECDSILYHEIDKMNGTESWMLKENLVIGAGSGRIETYLVMGSKQKTVIWVSIAHGAGCIDKGSKVEILFRDGSKAQLSNMSNFNCQEKSTVYFDGLFGTMRYLDQFCEKQIETIRVWSMKSYNQQDLSLEESNILKDAFNCMRNIKNQ